MKSNKNEHLSDTIFTDNHKTFILQLHTSIDDLREAVDPKILPKEYGGEVPLGDMIGEFVVPHCDLIFSLLQQFSIYYGFNMVMLLSP
jgi:hypothetical protein